MQNPNPFEQHQTPVLHTPMPQTTNPFELVVGHPSVSVPVSVPVPVPVPVSVPVSVPVPVSPCVGQRQIQSHSTFPPQQQFVPLQPFQSQHVPPPPTSSVQYVANGRNERFYFKKMLGQGHFGVVYLVQDFFDMEFVLKALKPESGTKAQVEQEWLKEIQLLSALQHPNIVSIYDYFVFNDLFYLVMERAHGNLREYVGSTGKMSTNDAIELSRQILSALNYMHSRNVIHRDLHVDNVLYILPEGLEIQPG
eukprot:TRINITY_DN4147_c2_g2_i2.p1 TRINITY_DN4147_c2_g2~~TRINITY_DN4147_c2_g2_i2.p1  ORF type:complete len:288 (-),score=59.68 TRINITY_DN4147_c2_g2_i2:31-783(-)